MTGVRADAGTFVSLHLDEADAIAVLWEIERISGEPVHVDVDEVPGLWCVGEVTVDEPSLPVAEAIERLARELRRAGVLLEHAPGRWRAVADPERPAPCDAAVARLGPSDEAMRLDAMEAEVIASITTVSATERTISKRGVELIRVNGAALVSRLKLVDEADNGKPLGVRVFGIRAESIASRLGFENGDRIERIASRRVDTPESVLAALTAVGGASKIDVTVWRVGKTTRLVTTVK